MTRDTSIKTLHDFTNSRYWKAYRESIYSNMAIDDDERYERVIEAARDGAEGSTHWECIDDQRQAIGDANSDGLISDTVEAKLLQNLRAVEAWHKRKGSLWEEEG